jgi:hypothetical protein
MTTAAIVALICTGLFAGSPRMAAITVICLAVTPIILTVFVLARELGLATLFR